MKEQLDRIEAKLDRVIKAMQEYDGLDEDFNEPEDEYSKYKKSPCVNHDEASWEEELKEKVVNASREFGKKKAAEAKEYLKDATFPSVPKPKKKYYHNKKKKDGNKKESS